MKKLINILLIILIIPILGINAQKAAPAKTNPAKTEPVKETKEVEEKEEKEEAEETPPTFNSQKMINIPSTVPVEKKNFDFRINHRFGNARNTTGDFIGMDNGANTEVSLDYGFTDKWSAGLSRIKDNKTYEGRTKFTFLTEDAKIPISMAFVGAVGLDTQKSVSSIGDYTATFGPYISLPSHGYTALDKVASNEANNYRLTAKDRTSFFGGILVSKRFGDFMSLQVSPIFVHKNYVKDQVPNDKVGLNFGGSIKINDDFRFIFETIAMKQRDYQGDKYAKADEATYGLDTKTQLSADAINTNACNGKACNFNNAADVAYMYARNVMYDKKVPHNYVPFSFGISYDTGGHIFQLFVTNTKSMAFTKMLDGADYNYMNKDWTVGFNINRSFKF